MLEGADAHTHAEGPGAAIAGSVGLIGHRPLLGDTYCRREALPLRSGRLARPLRFLCGSSRGAFHSRRALITLLLLICQLHQLPPAPQLRHHPTNQR